MIFKIKYLSLTHSFYTACIRKNRLENHNITVFSIHRFYFLNFNRKMFDFSGKPIILRFLNIIPDSSNAGNIIVTGRASRETFASDGVNIKGNPNVG